MDETKNRIIRGAIELLANDPNTTLDKIAKHIGISRRTLYRHCTGRKDLIESVLDYMVQEYLVSVDNQLRQDIPDLDKLKALLFNDIKSMETYLVFNNIQRVEKTDFHKKNTNVKKLHLLYRQFFESLIDQGLIADAFTVEWVEAYYTSVVEASIRALQNNLSIEECQNMAWMSFKNGIINNK